tara:strand:- start:1671 stop:2480 length:810 start_codon:yes stop_codon:yes gene_type:complete
MKPKKQIENIFSTTPTKTKQPNPKTPIIIDTREKQSLVASHLAEQNANIKFEKLEIGDYLISNIGIERKTFSDFISSMLNKRLQEQLINLKKYPKHFLIIEGWNQNTERELTNNYRASHDGWEGGTNSLSDPKKFANFKIHPNAIRGMLLSIILDFNIPIIFTQDEKDTATFLLLITKKFEKTPTPLSLRPSKTPQSLKQQKQFILEGFPGIGPTISKQLLDSFPSLEKIFTASREQLKTITNLTEDKIEKIKLLLESCHSKDNPNLPQ